MQCLSDEVTEISDCVDDCGLLSSCNIVPLHQIVLQRDEVQSVARDATTVHLQIQNDSIVHLDDQTPDRTRTEQTIGSFSVGQKYMIKSIKRKDDSNQETTKTQLLKQFLEI